MKKYSLYLFDFDGTLFDTLDSLKEVYRISLEKYGAKVKEEEYASFLGESIIKTFNRKVNKPEFLNEFCVYFNDIINDPNVYSKTKLYKETIQTLEFLNKNNINYGIVTGSSSKRVKDVFDYFKLDFSHVKVVIGNDSYKKPKPDKEPIEIALKRLDYMDKINEVLYIGDTPQDKYCAINNGVDYLLIDRENGIDLLSAFKDYKK